MKLHLLQLGLLQPLAIPIPGYAIQTDDGMNILVDSGYPYDDPPARKGH
jgi:N-acyl homoserine lactone hydrolase